MRSSVCDDAFSEVKQFVLREYDAIFPFAITKVDNFQIRVLIDLWDRLPEEDKEALKQNTISGGWGVPIPDKCESTREYLYNYTLSQSYLLHTKIWEEHGILSQERIFFIDRRDINAIQEQWIREEWRRRE